jgi:putative serine protease PepD
MNNLSQRPRLVRSDGQEIAVNGQLTIGRLPECSVQLVEDIGVSRRHALLKVVNQRVILSDLNSSNGTWLNDQKIIAPTELHDGDRLRISKTEFVFKAAVVSVQTEPPPVQPQNSRWQQWGMSLFVVGIVALGAIAIILLISVFLVYPQIKTGMQSVARQQALHALVIVIVPVGDIETTDTASNGSGSLLNKSGVVLTNFHVIADPETGEYYNSEGLVFVGLNWNNPEAEPDTFYRCRIVDTDKVLDLALLQVTATENGNTLPDSLTFPFIRVGNADRLEMGNQITIIGFPGTGGTTPTFTNGVVSGFYPDGNLEQGWIKTDAEISAGNSGGLAIDQDGELIGIPTAAVTGGEALGKIGYVRPINLALPLIQNYLP